MEQLPKHIGIIMDGNGRWAKARGLKRSQGHIAGADNLKKLLRHIQKWDIPYISIYAFSSENFKRSEEEVSGLMKLFVTLFQKEFQFLKKENVRVCFSGRKEPLPEKVLQSMDKIQEETKLATGATLNICLNYGGQDEIVDAMKKIGKQLKDGVLDIDQIDRSVVEQNLYQNLPPLDFVIRTSGEKRISNFMLWQSAYAEYYFPEVYFPDFNEEEFDRAIEVYQSRDRRYGGIKDENKNS